MKLGCRTAALAAIALACRCAARDEYSVRVEKNVSATMRDGVKLISDIFRPEADGKFPVLLGRTPYGKQYTPAIAEPLAKRGYIVAIQDVRGRGESAGKFEPFLDDEKDGYDSIEWAAGLPQSNGKVGMILSSYGASAQIFAALAGPPHLVTIIAWQPAIGFGSHEIFFEGGAFRQLWAESWTVLLASDSYSRMMRRLAEDGPSLNGIMRPLPLENFMDHLSREALEKEGGSYFREWLSNAPGSPYWEPLNLAKRVANIKVPGLYVGGWYDVFGPATAALFAAVQANGGSELARTKSQLVMGPWTHGGKGDIDFGPAASAELAKLTADYQNQWLDYWLKGERNEIVSHPAVRVFLTGQNRWIDLPQWPAPGGWPYRLFLSSTNSAQSSSGDGVLTPNSIPAGPSNRGNDILDADPSNPIPTEGGNLCCHKAHPAGPYYQNEIEKRRDVLVYTTAPLDGLITIAGESSVTLNIATDAADIDLIAKLLDVSPDGKAWNVAEGALRLRYRTGTQRPEWLAPGKVYKVSIRLGPITHTFLAGHSIRLQLAGSDFPNYSVNLNSGESLVDGTHPRVARTVIEHTPQLPSSLQLPRLDGNLGFGVSFPISRYGDEAGY